MKHVLLRSLLLAGLAGCSKKEPVSPTPAPSAQQLLLGEWKLEKMVYPVPGSATGYAHLDSTLYSPPSTVYGITYQLDGTWLGGTGTAGKYNTGTYTFSPPILTYASGNTETVLQLTAQHLVTREQAIRFGVTYTTLRYYVK
jgi:hypothetical protein